MAVVGLKPKVCLQFIGEHVGAGLDVLLDVGNQGATLGIRDDGGLDLPTALEYALNASLTRRTTAAPFHRAGLAVPVHVPGLAAAVGFVNLDFAAQFAAVVFVLHREANPVEHEPRGLLSDPKRPMQFPRT